MKTCVVLFLAMVAFVCHGQSTNKFNLDFEQGEGQLPNGWIKWTNNYNLSRDTVSHGGRYAVRIESDSTGSSFGSVAYPIPAAYKGAFIRLEGYMKLEDVKNGFAGLLVRIDAAGTSLAFDNMHQQHIDGTKDWAKYSITLNYPEDGEMIYVAGLLVGQGKAWFDDFVVTIDNQDIQELIPQKQQTVFKAQLDKEFDEGSKIEFPNLDQEVISNLALLGRIWGFLKYHHPAIARGDINWDYELFRVLPTFLSAKNHQQRDKVLSQWISGLGSVERCTDCRPTADDAVLKPQLTWIRESKVSKTLQEELLYIYENRHQGKHYYVRLTPGVKNPEFTNENAYGDPPYPDSGFRLLALYRLWNIVNYYFPNRHLCDEPWDNVLPKFIQAFVTAKDELAYEFAAVQAIGAIQDSHANLWGGGDEINAWKGRFYPPVHVRFIENQLVVADYYNPAFQDSTGLEIGDVITQINQKPVDKIVAELSPYYPASNEPTRLRDISRDILRSDLTAIDIKYTRNAKESDMQLPLYEMARLDINGWYKGKDTSCYKMLQGNIGYITLKSIKSEDIPVIKKSFKETKGIIIDIRNYPSTFVPFLLGTYFVSEPTPFAKFTVGNIENPGEFTFTEPVIIPPSDDAYQGKLVVLVNENSQSQSEYTAMAFKASNHCTIIGSTTAGADGNVSRFYLPGGLSTMISGIGVYYPDGTETQRVGIIPDIVATPTIEGIRNGKDEVLEKAIAFINQ